MPNRCLYLLLAAIVAVIALLFAAFHNPPEPSCGGKKLSDWVDRYAPEGAGFWLPSIGFVRQPHGGSRTLVRVLEADAAIREIGPKAVPYLLQWMQCELPPPWKESVYQMLSGRRWGRHWAGRVIGGERWERANSAVSALQALGSQGTNAVTELACLLNDPSCPTTASRSAMVLGKLGPPGIQPLMCAVTNAQLAAYVRRLAADCLRLSGQAVLRSFLTNSDPVVRDIAINSLPRAQ